LYSIIKPQTENLWCV